jgi:ornithine decarboxylase
VGRASSPPAAKAEWRPELNVAPQRIAALVAEHGAPLLMLSREAVRRQFRALRAALPGVELHYALKPLPHASVVATVAEEGGCFDLATAGEVAVVAAAGVDPARTIHTHPIKTHAQIAAALAFGTRTFVFDNELELAKFLPERARVELLLRVSFCNKENRADLSRKFGVAPKDALRLLGRARDLGVVVRGLSFHVGSQTLRAENYVEALHACREIFDAAARELALSLDTIDIGGGFPVPYTEPVPAIDAFCAPIRAALATLFGGCRVLAEPGRFIAAPAMTLAVSVMGSAPRAGGATWYYLDDGVYGSYSGVLNDHGRYTFVPLRELLGEPPAPRVPCVLAGPTCDSIDVVEPEALLPQLTYGDVLVSPKMGAYSAVTATDFNFFPRAKIVVVD